MRIVLAITGLQRGGAEKQICDLADVLVEKNHQVCIYSFMKNPKITPKNSNVEIIQGCLSKNILSFVVNIVFFIRCVRKYQPNIVHSHLFHANILSRLAKLLFVKTPLICSIHNTNTGGLFREKIYQLTQFLCDLTTNVSDEAVEKHVDSKAMNLNSSMRVYNGFDSSKFHFKDMSLERKQRFLAAGSLTEQKNFKGLINSFIDVVKLHPKATLDIAGEGVQYLDLLEIIHKNEMSSKVRLLGFKDNLPLIMGDYDYFVLSSDWEGFGMVVSEAMLVGLPVVATNCGGVSEVMIEHDFLIPKNDSSALTDGMIRLLELDDERYKSIQKKGRKHIEDNFSIETIANQWIKIYQNLINCKSL